MLKSYFKVAFRTFSRNRLITFINVFGLGLAMSVGMMIMIRFQFESGFDSFHPNSERIYRITSEYHKKSGETWRMASTSLPLQKKISDQFKDVEKAVNLYPALNGKVKSGEKELYLNGVFTEPAFFDIFGFTLAAGNAATALTQPNSLVISRATADRFFGTENPMGKLFTLPTGENFIVTGVLNEPVSKSQLLYDAYASWSSVAQLEAGQSLSAKSTDWFALNTAYTFVLLPDEHSKASVEYQLQDLTNELNKLNTDGKLTFYIQPLSNINPSWQQLGNEMPGVNPWAKIITEVAVSLIILLAACFNYTNLTIARAITRAREVGVRKINGARRSDVFIQYIIEALSLSMLALGFAWVLLSFIIRYAPFNDGYEFIPSAFNYTFPFVLSTVGFALFAGLLAGIAPAWILSSFSPLRVLKNLTTARIMGKVSIQKTLIVFQYSLSLTIIIFLLTFYRQFSYMGSADPGFKRDNILVVPLDGLNNELAAQKLNQVAGVRSTGAMSAELSKHSGGMFIPAWISDPSSAVKLQYHYADGAFIQQMGLKILAGKNFGSTNTRQLFEPIVINEIAANN
ncbi:MAG: ABC transporter permease, partial [Agriterribacter sp.]